MAGWKQESFKYPFPDPSDRDGDETFYIIFKDDQKVSLKSRDSLNGYFGQPNIALSEINI